MFQLPMKKKKKKSSAKKKTSASASKKIIPAAGKKKDNGKKKRAWNFRKKSFWINPDIHTAVFFTGVTANTSTVPKNRSASSLKSPSLFLR
jgi:hypothetical protein